MSAVASLADTITVLNEGMKIADGKLKEIVSNPVVLQAYLGGES
jgi:branched-chain amino acid transport system ATP-binding protein